MTKSDDKLLSIKEVYGELRVSRSTFYNYREMEDFPKPCYTLGSRPKYWRSEIIEFANRHRTAEQSADLSGGGLHRQPATICESDIAHGKKSEPDVHEAGTRNKPTKRLATAVVSVIAEAGVVPAMVFPHQAISSPPAATLAITLDKLRRQAATNSVESFELSELLPLGRVRELIERNASLGKPTFVAEIIDELQLHPDNSSDRELVDDLLKGISRSLFNLTGRMLGLMVFPDTRSYFPLPSQAELARELGVDVSTPALYIEHLKKIVEQYEPRSPRQPFPFTGEFEFWTLEDEKCPYLDLPRFVRRGTF